MPIFGEVHPNAGEIVDDAKVTITDGNVSADLKFDSIFGYYSISTDSIELVSGRTYKLSVKTPDNRSSSATCTIPDKRNNSLEFVSMDSVSNDSSAYLRLKFQLQDFPNQDNYYRVHIVYKYLSIFSSDTLLAELDISDNKSLISDNNRDGEKIIITTEFEDIEQGMTLVAFQLYLLTIDEHYYRFHNSLNKYMEMEGFFVEPTLVYSNIEGGLGVFASYNQAISEHEL